MPQGLFPLVEDRSCPEVNPIVAIQVSQRASGTCERNYTLVQATCYVGFGGGEAYQACGLRDGVGPGDEGMRIK